MYYFHKNIADKHFCCEINHLTIKKYLYLLSFKTTKYVQQQQQQQKSDRPILSFFFYL